MGKALDMWRRRKKQWGYCTDSCSHIHATAGTEGQTGSECIADNMWVKGEKAKQEAFKPKKICVCVVLKHRLNNLSARKIFNIAVICL